MKVKIDQDKCIGCGACFDACPDGIEMINNKAVIKNDNLKCLKKASEVCPINIIKFIKNENKDQKSIEKNLNVNTGFLKNKNKNFGQGQGGRGKGFGFGQNQGNRPGKGMGSRRSRGGVGGGRG